MLTLLLLHNTNALLARPSSLLFPFLTHFRCFFFVMDTVLASCNLQSCDIPFSPKRPLFASSRRNQVSSINVFPGTFFWFYGSSSIWVWVGGIFKFYHSSFTYFVILYLLISFFYSYFIFMLIFILVYLFFYEIENEDWGDFSIIVLDFTYEMSLRANALTSRE